MHIPQKRSPRHAQRGHAMIVGIIIMALIIITVLFFVYSAVNTKSEPGLKPDPITVTADDLLTEGDNNAQLAIDAKIIDAGIKRDEEQRKAANEVLNDEPLPVGTGVTPDTVIEATRLSQLQTEFINEADRRIKALAETSKLAVKLEPSQKPAANTLITDETTILTGLKAKASAETDKNAFLKDRDELDKQYINFTLAQAQVRMLLWANAQAVLDEKINVWGGKFQDRINEASNNGTDTAKSQTLMNTFQTSKKSARDSTAAALKAVNAVKPNTFNANRPVLKSYYDQLSSAHNEIEKSYKTGTELLLEVRGYKR